MPKEIERRFLVTECRVGKKEKSQMPFDEIRQGYFETPPALGSFRIRIYNDDQAILYLKEGRGEVRDEYPCKIPIKFGRKVLRVAPHKIEKTRYYKDGWEIDFLKGPLKRIVLAEYEAKRHSDLPKTLPLWIGLGIDVTSTLTNHHLARLATFLETSGVDPLTFILKHLNSKKQ